MKDIADITACVFDHGLFLPVARSLSKNYKRVLYMTPTSKAFPVVNDHVIGDGFPELERIDCFWPMLDEIDLFVFPDLMHSGLQLQLESMGKPVWGSRDGDAIETRRRLFLELLEQVGLDVAPHQYVTGLSELREALRDEQDKYIKISKYRGSMETWHWRNWAQDESKLDLLAVKFGAVKDMIPFIIFDNVQTEIEVGYDGYCIDGKFPALGIQGYEAKDEGFLCRLQPYDQLPEQVQKVNAKFGPVLAEYRYRNFWSTEIRVTPEADYFIDPCCRCPSPSTECQLALYDNLGEIIWRGAQGELVEPESDHDYAGSVVLTVKHDRKSWIRVEFPEELKEHVACGSCCQVEHSLCFPPNDDEDNAIGWLVATGDSPTEVVESLRELSESLPDGVDVSLSVLVNLIKEIETAEEEGIEFSPTLPSVEEVVK